MKKNVVRTEQVSFSISGEFITDYARNRTLEGEWDSAREFLKNSLIGMTDEQAFYVITGEAKITGDSSLNNITMEQDNESEEYKSMLQDYYCHGFFTHNKIIYKSLEHVPESQIRAIAKEHGIRAQEESEFYSIDLVKHILVDRHEQLISFDDYNHVIARRSYNGEFPDFISKDQIPDFSTFIKENYNIELSPHDKSQKLENSLKEEILDACQKRNVSWKTELVKIKDKEVSVTYPVEIMEAYIAKNSIDYWKPVSKAGWKMQNDSAWHTDLWIAMGYALDDAYDFDSTAYQVFQKVVAGYRFADLSSDKFVSLNKIPLQQFTGMVVTEKSKTISDQDILVLPNANLKYEAIAKKAGLIVVENGTELSHLAIYGKQESLPVIQMRNALSLLKEGEMKTVDFTKNTINSVENAPKRKMKM